MFVSEKKGIFHEKVEVETVSLNVPFNKMYAPLLVHRLRAAVRRKGVDLLLSRAWNVNAIVSIAGLLANTPFVLFLSGSTRREGQPRFKLAAEGMLLRRASRIISVSEAAKKNCIKAYSLSPSLIEVVHNGIKIDEIQALSEHSSEDEDLDRMKKKEGFDIVFVGRVIPRKGLDVLLQAVRGLEKKTNVWVIGGGETARYEALAEELKVREQVEFLGRKENPFPALKHADLFVLPSRSEGFPNVLLEAMALARPVLAADCETGPSEIIDGTNGWLFPVEDSETLRRQISDLIEDDYKRTEMGRKAKETVRDNFRLETQLSKIEAVLLEAGRYGVKETAPRSEVGGHG
jgi:glycosyltransferase involved in cell wall biosynthesis